MEGKTMRLTKEIVIQTAAEIADKDGLAGVSLKAVAEKLAIRTPSLYNHIDSLDGLLREMAHRGMREMNARMLQAAVGQSGDAAIKSVSTAYLEYMIAHPGVYEAIQWALWHGSAETAEIFEQYKSLLVKLILSCRLKNPDTGEILNVLTGFLHGYCTMQLGEAIKNPEGAVRGLEMALDTVLLGIHGTYGQG